MARTSAAFLLAIGVGAGGRSQHGSHKFGNESIWGECASNNAGACILSSDFQCSSRLAAGPANARWELKLTQLPKSEVGAPVHLHWWAGRKFEPSYDILSGPASDSCMAMHLTYPKYSHADFNGGNVAVSEDGNAIIKVHSPALYGFNCKRVLGAGESSHRHKNGQRNHHIHFRLCGGTRTLFKAGKIDFSDNDVFIKGCSLRNGDEVSFGIEYVKDLTTGNLRVPTSTNNYHNLFSQWVWQNDTAEESVGEVNQKKPELPFEVVRPGKHFNSEQPDLDALESSAVYNCMDQRVLFSQFTKSCTESCENNQTTVHSQCVRKRMSDRPLSFTAHWRLCLDCGKVCWAERAEETLHALRLALADLLDVPFQEARNVRFRFDDGRRLAAAVEGFEASLTIRVVTDRVSEADGMDLLASFMSTSEDAESVLGMTVFKIKADHKVATAALADSLQDGEDEDLYLEHYAKLEVNLSDDIVVGTKEGLPVGLLVGISAVVMVGAAFLSNVFFYLRRKVTLQMAEEAAVEADTLGKLDNKVNKLGTPAKEPDMLGKLDEQFVEVADGIVPLYEQHPEMSDGIVPLYEKHPNLEDVVFEPHIATDRAEEVKPEFEMAV